MYTPVVLANLKRQYGVFTAISTPQIHKTLLFHLLVNTVNKESDKKKKKTKGSTNINTDWCKKQQKNLLMCSMGHV